MDREVMRQVREVAPRGGEGRRGVGGMRTTRSISTAIEQESAPNNYVICT